MKKYLFITFYFLNTALLAFQPVDLNRASVEQIALLPGMGQKIALNIVEFRNKHGRISSLAALRGISGLTDKKLEQIKNHVIFSQASFKKEELVYSLDAIPLPPLFILEALVLKSHRLTVSEDLSLANRARHAAYLPKLSAYADMGDVETISDKLGVTSKDNSLKRQGRNFGLGIKLTFDLDKLIFNSDELEIAKLGVVRNEKRAELIELLHKNYFRHISLNETVKLGVDKATAASIAQELLQIEASLNALSGGALNSLTK